MSMLYSSEEKKNRTPKKRIDLLSRMKQETLKYGSKGRNLLTIPTAENRPFDRDIRKLRRLGLIRPLNIGNKL
ncbi:hypothetical protein Lal_00042162 [Lupinus albus]|nr:hypothetical protein Lal_00042162 [Lupinus albus]